jgi:anti-sigma factor RsiW
MTASPVTEDDLHAYLDGQLGEDRRELVDAHLRDHPEDAQRLEAYRADGDAIARIFAQAGQVPQDTTTPFRFSTSLTPRGRTAAAGSAMIIRWRQAAAVALVCAGALIAAFWVMRQDGSEEAMWARFGTDAMAAHQSLSNPGAQPVLAVSPDELSDYLSARLKKRVELRRPTYADYTLVGSRFVTTPKGRVAQLAFKHRDGALLTMYLEPWPKKADAPFRIVARQSDVITMLWVDDEIGCAVSGTLPPDRLEKAARSLYEAMFG